MEPLATNSNYTILIVDDDVSLCEVLESIVSAFGFKTKTAHNGLEAQDIIKNENIDLVISDIQMPQMTGVELIEWVRRLYDSSFRKTKPLPFILMTGFAHLFQTQKAHELGVEEFLTKPFDDETLCEAIYKELNIEDPNKAPDEPAPVEITYCKASLEDFVSTKTLEMDIYVMLKKDKYIKIAHKDEVIDVERIHRYRDKGLKYLYVRKEDFRKVLDFNIMLSKVLTKSDDVTIEKKKRFMAHTSEVIFENAMVNGVDEEFFNDAKDFLLSSMDILTEDSQTFSLLQVLNGHSDGLYAHSLAVSMYSVMIAKQAGWSSSSTLFKLSFGGIMHDIGKKELDPVLLEKSRSELSYTERQLLETHPLRGKEILESLKSAPSEVVAITYEHHENLLGQGFPRQLTKKKISPMARIVSVADEFCSYALKNAHHPGVSAQKAIFLMEQYKADKLDPDFFEALKKVVVESDSKSKIS